MLNSLSNELLTNPRRKANPGLHWSRTQAIRALPGLQSTPKYIIAPGRRQIHLAPFARPVTARLRGPRPHDRRARRPSPSPVAAPNRARCTSPNTAYTRPAASSRHTTGRARRRAPPGEARPSEHGWAAPLLPDSCRFHACAGHYRSLARVAILSRTSATNSAAARPSTRLPSRLRSATVAWAISCSPTTAI